MRSAGERLMRHAPFPDLEHLASIFAQYPEVQAVYLFGLVATGRMHAESDLDLAIVPRPETGAVPKRYVSNALYGPAFTSTPPHLHISTPPHLRTSTPPHLHTSTPHYPARSS